MDAYLQPAMFLVSDTHSQWTAVWMWNRTVCPADRSSHKHEVVLAGSFDVGSNRRLHCRIDIEVVYYCPTSLPRSFLHLLLQSYALFCEPPYRTFVAVA